MADVGKALTDVFFFMDEIKLNKQIPFTINFDTLKSEQVGDDKIIIGVATDTSEDKQNEIITERALKQMQEQISKGGINLMASHNADWDDELGEIIDAKVEDNKLIIKAKLDDDNSKAMKLWNALQKGKQLGLSVGGNIIKALWRLVNGQTKKFIDDIALDHICITGRPANPRTWVSVLAKSLDAEIKKSEDEKMAIDEMIKALVEYLKGEEKDETKIAEMKKAIIEAMKQAKIGEGKKEEEALAEAEAELGAILEKELPKKDEEEIKKKLAEISAKYDDVMKALTERLEKSEKQVDDLKKIIEDSKNVSAERKAIIEKSERFKKASQTFAEYVKSDEYRKLSRFEKDKALDDKFSQAVKEAFENK